MMSSSRRHGLTLVEVLVSIAIVSIIVSLAAPSFTETIARARLDGTVSGLANDLQYTRTEAIRRRTTATLTVAADGASYAVTYIVPSTNAALDPPLKTVTMPDSVALAATAPVVFDGLRGIAAGQTFTATSTKTTAQLQISTNANGRVQLCSPSGTYKAYPSC